jgi:hypothetical protein
MKWITLVLVVSLLGCASSLVVKETDTVWGSRRSPLEALDASTLQTSAEWKSCKGGRLGRLRWMGSAR